MERFPIHSPFKKCTKISNASLSAVLEHTTLCITMSLNSFFLKYLLAGCCSSLDLPPKRFFSSSDKEVINSSRDFILHGDLASLFN